MPAFSSGFMDALMSKAKKPSEDSCLEQRIHCQWLKRINKACEDAMLNGVYDEFGLAYGQDLLDNKTFQVELLQRLNERVDFAEDPLRSLAFQSYCPN